jgi:hypothetical protein
MKKLITFAILFLGLSQVSFAQDKLVVKIDKKVCLDELTIVFKDQSRMLCQLGCYGEYEFDISGKVFDHITINGTDCFLGAKEIVTVNSGEQAKNKIINVGNTIVDDLNGLIR